MKFFEIVPKTNIDFMKHAPVCASISAALVAASVLLWAIFGFHLSIEFTGGTVLEVQTPEAPEIDIAQVRAALDAPGFERISVVTLGEGAERSFLITTPESEEEFAASQTTAEAPRPPAAETPAPVEPAKPAEAAAPTEPASAAEPAPAAETPPATENATPAEEAPAATPAPAAATSAAAAASETDAPTKVTLAQSLLTRLEQELGTKIVPLSIETVGPRVGGELARSGFIALFLTSLAILIYIAVSFDRVYAPGAVVAVVHDVVVTAGVFVLFQIEFDLQVLAALLVVLGYSINDTIVIYDRIRETVALRGVTHFKDVVNQALNETLSRTILTSLTVLFVVLSLLFFGGPVLRNMSLALTIGVIAGVYSTVYVASALLVFLQARSVRQGGAKPKTGGQGGGDAKPPREPKQPRDPKPRSRDEAAPRAKLAQSRAQ